MLERVDRLAVRPIRSPSSAPLTVARSSSSVSLDVHARPQLERQHDARDHRPHALGRLVRQLVVPRSQASRSTVAPPAPAVVVLVRLLEHLELDASRLSPGSALELLHRRPLGLADGRALGLGARLVVRPR